MTELNCSITIATKPVWPGKTTLLIFSLFKSLRSVCGLNMQLCLWESDFIHATFTFSIHSYITWDIICFCLLLQCLVTPLSLLTCSFCVFLLQTSKCPEGTKPMLVFAGEAFDTDNEHKRLKSLLIGKPRLYSVSVSAGFALFCLLYHPCLFDPPPDFFRGPTVSAVRLAGLEHVLHFTALEGKIYMRSYRYFRFG